MSTGTLARALITGLLTFCLIGCGPGKSGTKAVDTSPIEKAFAAGTPERSEVDKAATVIRAGNYPSALATLRQLALTPELKPEQRQAINQLITELESRVSSRTRSAPPTEAK